MPDKKTEKTSIIFYKEWYDGMRELTPELQLKLFHAVMNYQFYGIEPEDKIIKGMFIMTCKKRIEKDNDLYVKRREAGRKGLENRWQAENAKSADVIANDSKTLQTVANDSKNDFATVCNSVYVYDNIKEKRKNKFFLKESDDTEKSSADLVSLAEAKQYAAEKGILSEGEVEEWFLLNSQTGWKAKTGLPIVSWRSSLGIWAKYKRKQNAKDEAERERTMSREERLKKAEAEARAKEDEKYAKVAKARENWETQARQLTRQMGYDPNTGQLRALWVHCARNGLTEKQPEKEVIEGFARKSGWLKSEQHGGTEQHRETALNGGEPEPKAATWNEQAMEEARQIGYEPNDTQLRWFWIACKGKDLLADRRWVAVIAEYAEKNKWPRRRQDITPAKVEVVGSPDGGTGSNMPAARRLKGQEAMAGSNS